MKRGVGNWYKKVGFDDMGAGKTRPRFFCFGIGVKPATRRGAMISVAPGAASAMMVSFR